MHPAFLCRARTLPVPPLLEMRSSSPRAFARRRAIHFRNADRVSFALLLYLYNSEIPFSRNAEKPKRDRRHAPHITRGLCAGYKRGTRVLVPALYLAALPHLLNLRGGSFSVCARNLPPPHAKLNVTELASRL